MKTKRGASMLWVLCLMCVVLIIGGSILTAGAISSGVALRYREAKNCYNYATTLADILIDDIDGSVSDDDDDPWRSIAQGVYDAKIKKNTNAVLDNIELNVDFSNADFSAVTLDTAPVTVMNIKLTKQIVTVDVPYSSTVTEPQEPDDEPVTTIIREISTVKFTMIIELRTSIGEQTHVVFLKFDFNGKTEGTDDGPNTGQINGGTFYYNGAFDSMP